MKMRGWNYVCSVYNNHSIYVLSARTITECKQLQASGMERSAVITLYTRPPELKAIVHFDSTVHSSIADVLIYQLKPLFFLYQDQEQISTLFVEMLSWLAMTFKCNLSKSKYATFKFVGENWCIDTGTVTKNLIIEDTIWNGLKSTCKPYHLYIKVI